MKTKRIATIAFLGVGALQVMTLLSTRRLEKNMARVEDEVKRLQDAVDAMGTAVDAEVSELNQINVELQTANSRNPDIDLSPQIDRIQALTARLSESAASATGTEPAPVTPPVTPPATTETTTPDSGTPTF